MSKYAVNVAENETTVQFEVQDAILTLKKLTNTEFVYSVSVLSAESATEIPILYEKDTNDILFREKEMSDIYGKSLKNSFHYTNKKSHLEGYKTVGLWNILYSTGAKAIPFGNPSLGTITFDKESKDAFFRPRVIKKLGKDLDFVKEVLDVYLNANKIFDEAITEYKEAKMSEETKNIMAEPIETIEVVDEISGDLETAKIIKEEPNVTSSEKLSKVLIDGFATLAGVIEKQSEMLRKISENKSVLEPVKEEPNLTKTDRAFLDVKTENTDLKDKLSKAEAELADLKTKYDCLMEDHLKSVQALEEANLEIQKLKTTDTVITTAKIKEDVASEKPETPIKKAVSSKEYTTSLSITDGVEISYKEWRKNTLSPFDEYGYRKDNGTVASILHKAYEVLTNRYGLVWSELQKDYGFAAHSTMERLYYYETRNAGQRGLLKGVINTILMEESKAKTANKYQISYVSDIEESLRKLSTDANVDFADLKAEVVKLLINEKNLHWTKIAQKYREKHNLKSDVMLNPIDVIAQSSSSIVKTRVINMYNDFAKKKIAC